MKKLYKEYMLLKKLPTGECVGDHFFFHVCRDDDSKVWYQVGKLSKFASTPDRWAEDSNSQGVKLNPNQMTPEFFSPIGEPFDLYPPFPSKEEIKELYYLIGESRMVNSIDKVRAINQIFYSDEYSDACYHLLKKMYEEKFIKK